MPSMDVVAVSPVYVRGRNKQRVSRNISLG